LVETGKIVEAEEVGRKDREVEIEGDGKGLLVEGR